MARADDHDSSSADAALTLKEIYRIALDTRNMEIDLFWKRCNYFLILNSGLALAYFNVSQEALQIPAALLGVIVSMLWLQVALGSKFWQERWEDCLRSIEIELKEKKQYPSDNLLFSLDMDQSRKLVERSLRASRHVGLYSLLDTYVIEKPSVTAAMMYLVISFFVCWSVLFGYRLLAFAWVPLSS